MTPESELRESIIAAGRSLFDRGLTHGSTGNISVRWNGNILVTPTGSNLGSLDPSRLSVIDPHGNHVQGGKPSKEAFLHAAVLRARPQAHAVVHTHSTHAAALSCLDGLNPADSLPPLTAYFAMRVGRLPLLPYHAPGDPALECLAETVAQENTALLLANHGPIVAGSNLQQALDAVEELEETAKLFFILNAHPTRPLTSQQVSAIRPSS
ncbi:3-oxo-tetronate 4-phosphate decarboxylase [Sinomonas sp. JGH33]|uniref:3-oxo-tetronate 4-phosphate decarboxylase n=1 Tax=Sinomonas terricola TaxID=3110330 RepID=A0ABU5TBW5_9MICC|nr:3-oxo-tetronate 4-phosphate decarboxylase [Sinomonas sp. JGH33]MEA5457010.1 3-oxo-tetronate 4-phosphate decarboxylase [Sinomonas sp. JGH33]